VIGIEPSIVVSTTTLSVSATQLVNPQTAAEITLSNEFIDVRVEIPAGTFGEAVNITVSNTTAPVSDRPTIKITDGIAIAITNNKGLQPSKEITITIIYRDIDVVGFDKSKFVIGRYDEIHRRWIALASNTNPKQNKVVCKTKHLSKFAVLQLAPAGNLDSVIIYPNPYNPKRHPTGVIIDNLTKVANIKIYTIVGELVREIDYTTEKGIITWDGKNDAGRNVASGVYLVFIDSPEGKKTVKIAVER